MEDGARFIRADDWETQEFGGCLILLAPDDSHFFFVE